MLPLLLGSTALGATLGGIQGYQSSGGDLGATFRGAAGGGIAGGLGYGAQRMAGQALKTALTGGLGSSIAPEAYKASAALGGLKAGGLEGAKQAVAQAGLQSPLAQQMAGLNVLGKAAPVIAGAGGLAAGLAVPALAMPILGGVANLAGQAGSGALKAGAGVLGMKQPGAAEYSTDAIPQGLRQFGDTDPYGTPLDQLDPRGIAAGQRMMYQKNIELQRDAMRTLLPEIFNASEARSKNELQRQLAAAGVRQNILTAANMLERSQQAAQQMGANAASQAGAALTSQYQYS